MENTEPSELSPVPRPMEIPRVWCAMCGTWGYHKSGYCPVYFVDRLLEPGWGDKERAVFALSQMTKMVSTAFGDGWNERGAPSDPSGTDSSSATREKDLEEQGGVAAKKAEVPEMKRWESVAYWPHGTCGNGDVSTDTHETREAAEAVCRLLERTGFGGLGETFPTRTEVREVPSVPEESKSSSAPSVSSEKPSSPSAAAVSEEEKWTSADVKRIAEMSSELPIEIRLVNAHNASLERIRGTEGRAR